MLLCRETACTQLERALGACIAGTSGVVLLEGAAGCGKTELLLHFAATATGSSSAHRIVSGLGCVSIAPV